MAKEKFDIEGWAKTVQTLLEDLTRRVDNLEQRNAELHIHNHQREPGWRCKYPPGMPFGDTQPYYWDDGGQVHTMRHIVSNGNSTFTLERECYVKAH